MEFASGSHFIGNSSWFMKSQKHSAHQLQQPFKSSTSHSFEMLTSNHVMCPKQVMYTQGNVAEAELVADFNWFTAITTHPTTHQIVAADVDHFSHHVPNSFL